MDLEDLVEGLDLEGAFLEGAGLVFEREGFDFFAGAVLDLDLEGELCFIL
jgi:hypothetical protein